VLPLAPPELVPPPSPVDPPVELLPPVLDPPPAPVESLPLLVEQAPRPKSRTPAGAISQNFMTILRSLLSFQVFLLNEYPFLARFTKWVEHAHGGEEHQRVVFLEGHFGDQFFLRR